MISLIVDGKSRVFEIWCGEDSGLDHRFGGFFVGFRGFSWVFKASFRIIMKCSI